MPSLGSVAWTLVFFALLLGVAAVVYLVLRRDLARILDELLKLPAVTSFYLRAFLIALLFIAIACGFGKDFQLKPEAAFMEKVWAVASALWPLLAWVSVLLAFYLVLVTIIVASTRRKNEQ